MKSMIQKQIDRQGIAYSLIFNIENVLRVAIHNFLVMHEGTSYELSKIFPKFKYRVYDKICEFDIGKSIITKKKNEKEDNLAAGFEYPDIWYLEFPALTALIDNFWMKYFHDMFKDNNSIRNEIINEMKSLFTIRNSIAHNRYISEIDKNELQKFSNYLRDNLKNNYLFNYEALAFNKPDQLRMIVIDILEEFIKTFKQGRIIKDNLINELQSTMGILIQFRPKSNPLIVLIDNLLSVVKTYNQILPRKPGRGNEIKKFVEEKEIIIEINKLIEGVKKS